jgi:hypothetical protein
MLINKVDHVRHMSYGESTDAAGVHVCVHMSYAFSIYNMSYGVHVCAHVRAHVLCTTIGSWVS